MLLLREPGLRSPADAVVWGESLTNGKSEPDYITALLENQISVAVRDRSRKTERERERERET